jgi:hypothetical protein
MEDEGKAINQDEGKAGWRSPSAFDQGFGGTKRSLAKLFV